MNEILKEQQEFFKTNQTKTYEFRYKQLCLLEKAILENEMQIVRSLSKDLKRDLSESLLAEVHTVLEELRYYKKNLKRLIKPQKMKFKLSTFSSKGYTKYEPKGTTLIISPWNYPFYLTFVPLINNIGAGNTAIIKLSTRASNTAKTIETLLNNTFDKKYIHVLDTSEENYQAIKLNVDHIFFTGSTFVGKKIMKEASENLIPITLELGGKSPAIVTQTADIKKAVKEILWGKLLNSGQTCVAPDYVYVDSKVYEQLLEEIKAQIKKFKYENRGYIDLKHKEASLKLLEDNEVIFEHNFKEETFYITKGQKKNLKETEIFSMILPIVKYDEIDEVFSETKFPLATYIFSSNKKEQSYIVDNIICRGFTINGTISHLINNSLPFGGIKTSGMGSYHGESGFYELTYSKAVLKRGWFTPFFIFPPYNYSRINKILKLVRRFEGK